MPASLDDVRRERLALGKMLAAFRKAGGYTQASFAPLTNYGRSTIANVETGMQHVDREFWVRCDRLLGASGELVAEYDRIELIVQAQRRQALEHLHRPVSRPAGSVLTTVLRHAVGADTTMRSAKALSSLRHRVAEAHRALTDQEGSRPALVVVGGYAGCGKTDFGQLLAGLTGWPLLDKDLLTRPLVENLLAAIGEDPNDRQSAAYLANVRPVEYRCLLNATYAQLEVGNSCIVTAPFLRELPDRRWLQRLNRGCAHRNVEIIPVWVDADPESMYEYLQRRDAARDSWKLNNWDTYAAGLNPHLRPAVPHLVIDNARHAAIGLPEQADRLARLVSPA
jgi:transcriptional regulator with XRE-family HTH domain/predicted kinase